MTEPTNPHQGAPPDKETAPVAPAAPEPAAPAAPEPAAPAAPAALRPHRRPRRRAGELWVVLVAFALVLLLLMIFILQNGQRADVYFLGAHGHLPMGVALLLAAIFGVLLLALPMAVRVVQLRLMATRHRGRVAAAVQKEGADRGR